jgi:predicted nucleic acid-binding protein
MKTAMEEAIELVKKYDSKKIPFKVLFFNLENLLEKENKQIMDSWKEGTKYVMDINDGKVVPPMSAIDYLIYFKTEKSDYYTIFTDNKQSYNK